MGATHVSGPLYVGGGQITPGGILQMAGAETFYVDPELGNDGNDGSADKPVASLSVAYAKAISGRGDIIFIKGGPTSASSTGHTVRLSSAFTWAKHNTHLVGICAPTMVGQRARITGPSTGGTFSPLFTISGSGCIFANLNFFDDYTVDPVAILVTGDRNYFENVHIQGMGAATGADDAAAASLKLSGGDENTFVRCMIGLDTVPRSTTNAEIELVSAATRNIFRDCYIMAFADNAGHLFVKIDGSADIDRYVIFDRCLFYNGVESTATTMTQAMDVHNSCGGMVILKDCVMIGATDWAAADNGNVFADMGAASAGSAGLLTAVTR